MNQETEYYPSFDKEGFRNDITSRQEKFKTDFTQSIFDTSTKILNQRESRQYEIIEKNKKNSEVFKKTPSIANRDGFSSLMSVK